MPKLSVLIIAGFIFASTFVTVVNTEGHGVCALMSCASLQPCYPLTIIKECGVPVPQLDSYAEAITTISIIIIAVIGGLFASKHYFKRKDFYIVR